MLIAATDESRIQANARPIRAVDNYVAIRSVAKGRAYSICWLRFGSTLTDDSSDHFCSDRSISNWSTS